VTFGSSSPDIVNGLEQYCTSLVRPILEYSCQLWHAGLNAYHQELLESVQERALSMAFPLLAYDDALIEAGIPTLSERREELCKRLFTTAQDPTHKLHPLLPTERTITHNQRNAYKYPLPRVKTNRFKDTFMNHCLYNHW